MKQKRDYGGLEWCTIHGERSAWKDVEDRHLANIYAYLRARPERKKRLLKKYPGAMAWLRQEASRRGITHLFRNAVEYGPYPYRDPHFGWVVFDQDINQTVSVLECDVELLPPEARAELQVLGYLGVLDGD